MGERAKENETREGKISEKTAKKKTVDDFSQRRRRYLLTDRMGRQSSRDEQTHTYKCIEKEKVIGEAVVCSLLLLFFFFVSKLKSVTRREREMYR